MNSDTHVRGGQRPKTPHKRRPQKMSNLTQRIALFRKMKTIYKTEPKSSQSRPWAEQKWVENLFEGAFLLICCCFLKSCLSPLWHYGVALKRIKKIDETCPSFDLFCQS